MNRLLSSLYLAAAVSCCGCATTSQGARKALSVLPPTPSGPSPCDSADCAIWWQRSQIWLSRHSRLKIQTATDVMLQTYGASDAVPGYSFTITREPVGSGRYVARIEMQCGGGFQRCSPSIADVARAYSHYMRTGEDVLDGKDLSESSIR